MNQRKSNLNVLVVSVKGVLCLVILYFNAYLYQCDNEIVANKSIKSREMDLYEILQLTPIATETEIKSNYKQLALKHHPDKNNRVGTEEV
jgi:preprotein translocase subunit Sec63